MRDAIDDCALVEIRAVLAADLRTSGAKTAPALKDAAVESLSSLMPKPQTIVVEPCAHHPRRFNVWIEGPTLIGGLPVCL